MSGTDGAERVGEGAAPDNRALREAMAAMAALASEQTERAISALFAALAESFLLVPVSAAGEQGAELALVREADGRPALHAFTGEAALAAAFPAQSPRVGVTAAKLAEVVLAIPEATLVLDPGSPSAGRLSRRDLELVRERLAPGREGSAPASPSPPRSAAPWQRRRSLLLRSSPCMPSRASWARASAIGSWAPVSIPCAPRASAGAPCGS